MSNIRMDGRPAMAFAARAPLTACSIDMAPFTAACALRRARAAPLPSPADLRRRLSPQTP